MLVIIGIVKIFPDSLVSWPSLRTNPQVRLVLNSSVELTKKKKSPEYKINSELGFYNEITKYNYPSLNTHLLPSAGVNR